MIFTYKKPDKTCYIWTVLKNYGLYPDPQISRFENDDDGGHLVTFDDGNPSDYLFGDIIEEPQTWTINNDTWKRSRVPFTPTKEK